MPHGNYESAIEETKQVVLQTIIDHCQNTKKDLPPGLDEFAAHLEQGGGLAIEQILGGMTNLAFKVFLEDNPETAVFAKVCNPYPLWHPMKAKFDMNRVENEAEMMVWFSELTKNKSPSSLVAKPLFIKDFPGEAKLFVTEWVKTDVQFSKQFLDGNVDPRIIKKVAEALALLNLQPVDPDWNTGTRDAIVSLTPFMKQKFAKLVSDPDEEDAVILLCKQVGQDGFEKILDEFCTEMKETREALLHGDAHLLNVLVEEKPDADNFGENGDFVLVDWEMTMCGPVGKDVGIFSCLPILASLAHATQGNKEAAYHILHCCEAIWAHWSSFTVEHGNKDEAYLRKAFRQSLGAAAFYMFFAFYMLGKLPHGLGFEGVTDPESSKAAKSAIGTIGLSFFSIAYGGADSESNLEGLKKRFNTLISLQIEGLLKLQEKSTRPSLQDKEFGQPAPQEISSFSA